MNILKRLKKRLKIQNLRSKEIVLYRDTVIRSKHFTIIVSYAALMNACKAHMTYIHNLTFPYALPFNKPGVKTLFGRYNWCRICIHFKDDQSSVETCRERTNFLPMCFGICLILNLQNACVL